MYICMVAQFLGSSHIMTYWKCNSLQLFSAQSMQMSMWSCGIALFYILFNMSSFFPVYFSVYMPMSASMYHCYLSLQLFGSHWECISLSVVSFDFSLDLSFFLKPLDFPYLFPISWILLSTLSSLKTWRKIHCFLFDKQCDHSQLRNLLHFKLLPCQRE